MCSRRFSVYGKRVIVLFWTDKCVLGNKFGTCRRYLLGCENSKLLLEVCLSEIKALNFWSIFFKKWTLTWRKQLKGICLYNNKRAGVMDFSKYIPGIVIYGSIIVFLILYVFSDVFVVYWNTSTIFFPCCSHPCNFLIPSLVFISDYYQVPQIIYK